MEHPPLASEYKRIRDLAAIGIMDSLPEAAYDDIVTLASYICKTPIAYISFIDDKRQWYKSRKGIPFPETSIEDALCAPVLQETGLVHVPDLSKDPRFNRNRFVTTKDKAVRFYAGQPLVTSEGNAVGTLCVLDFSVRELDDDQKFALEALGRQVVAQLELRKVLSESRHLAVHDGLTGLPNRALLAERLALACKEAELNDELCAALFIDLDKFKDINDTHGHEAGDKVLAEVASRLRHALRKEDVVGRYGGDEFVAVLSGIDDEAAVIRIIDGIQSVLATPVAFEGKLLEVRASIGASLYPSHAESAEDLLRQADTALYKAKESGRNTHRLFFGENQR